MRFVMIGPCRQCGKDTDNIVKTAEGPDFLCADCSKLLRETDVKLARRKRRPSRGDDPRKRR
jgi:hypothetical protein